MSVIYTAASALLLAGTAPYFISSRIRSKMRWAAEIVNTPGPVGQGAIRAVSANVCTLFLLGIFGVTASIVHQPTTPQKIVLTAIAVGALASFIVSLMQIFLNRPRMLAPKDLREQPGALRLLIKKPEARG